MLSDQGQAIDLCAPRSYRQIIIGSDYSLDVRISSRNLKMLKNFNTTLRFMGVNAEPTFSKRVLIFPSFAGGDSQQMERDEVQLTIEKCFSRDSYT